MKWKRGFNRALSRFVEPQNRRSHITVEKRFYQRENQKRNKKQENDSEKATKYKTNKIK